MPFGQPRTALPLRSSAAKVAVVIPRFALLLVYCFSQQTASAALLPRAGGERLAAETQEQSRSGAQQTAAAEPALRLEDLERIALQNNPTLTQAEAAIRASEGRRLQAGLFPNPIIGYFGEEISLRAAGDRSDHGVFIEQTIPLGGKLGKSRRIFAEEKVQAEADAVAQRQRILNTVRMLFYEALGAQQLIDVRRELQRIASEAVGISGELFNVGQADRPDVLEGEVEAQRAELDLIAAENHRDQVWQQLGAVIGDPLLKPARLIGNLERGLPILDQQTVLVMLLRDSPEIKRAQAGIERARASLARAKAERVPDLFVRGGLGYNLERFDAPARLAGQRVGAEAQVEVGLRIPIFDRNQGNIAAASAELEIAEREARRVELILRARLAAAFRTYQNTLRLVSQYEQQVIPRAERAYSLYLTSFRQMAASYPQVLIAQRTFFQVRAEHVNALVDAWQSAIQLQGFLLVGGLEAPACSAHRGRKRSEVTTP
jgi:cobalt-zinc-cadmium efflux system outer membrane protein